VNYLYGPGEPTNNEPSKQCISKVYCLTVLSVLNPGFGKSESVPISFFNLCSTDICWFNYECI